jgi:hypothetical protein
MALLAEWTEFTIRLPNGNQNQTNRRNKLVALAKPWSEGRKALKSVAISQRSCAYELPLL